MIKTADGVVLHHDDWESNDNSEKELITKIKNYGKPVIIALSQNDIIDANILEKKLQYYVSVAIDVITVSESVLNTVENPLDYIQHIFSTLQNIESLY
jgi:predicted GTPase